MLRTLAHAGAAQPFVPLLARDILAASPAWRHGAAPKRTLLALTPERFRGDLEILQQSGEIRVLRLPRLWQSGLLGLFWTDDMRRRIDMKRDYFRDDLPADIRRIQERIRRFFGNLIPPLYRRLGVDGTLGAAVWYQQDYDWGLQSERAGAPYIVLHLENLATAPGHVERLIYNTRRMGRFVGRRIVVHNAITRQAFIDAGYVEPDRVEALGALRMDGFLERIARAGPRRGEGRRPSVVLFSFHRGTGLWGVTDPWPADPAIGLTRFFGDVHRAMGELARARPDVDFVIKPKWGGRWVEEIEKALAEAGVEPARQANLKILPDAQAQDLILAADVVCGYGSTTLLEAGVSGCEVVMPFFAEAARPEYRDFVQFRDEMELFTVARSADEFRAAVLGGLERPQLDERRRELCHRAFERHVSSLSGGTLQRYLAAIDRAFERECVAP